jgi:hypothetical protein
MKYNDYEYIRGFSKDELQDDIDDLLYDEEDDNDTDNNNKQ